MNNSERKKLARRLEHAACKAGQEYYFFARVKKLCDEDARTAYERWLLLSEAAIEVKTFDFEAGD